MTRFANSTKLGHASFFIPRRGPRSDAPAATVNHSVQTKLTTFHARSHSVAGCRFAEHAFASPTRERLMCMFINIIGGAGSTRAVPSH